VLQELIEVEAAEYIGVGRHERIEARTTDRNGSRRRLLATQAGRCRAAHPRPSHGGRIGPTTIGVSTRVAALAVASGVSKSELSRSVPGSIEIVGAFRTRRLDHIEFKYAYLDATYFHVRNTTGKVTSMAVVIATGIAATSAREVLGVDIGDSEDDVFWRGFLRSLKSRGLSAFDW
jgi:putative transposase